MIKGIITGLIVLVMGIGGYVSYVFYKKIQNPDVEIAQTTVSDEANENIKGQLASIPKLDSSPELIADRDWTSTALQKAKDATYQFPSNVLDINLQVKKYDELKIDYTKVLVQNLDDYKFLCINEVLRQRHIDFSYFKHKDSLDLLLFIPDENKRKLLLKDFDYYNIDYKINIKS